MRKYLLFWICLNFSITSFGQTPRPMENSPTPNAASFGEYGKIPISLYTGTPQVSIPLDLINEGNISMPIELNYNLSSMKANNVSGWVGAGWNFQPGGCISRNVRGIYDEKQYSSGYQPGFYAHATKMKNITEESLKYHAQFMQAFEGTEYELMADEFSFNFCGYTGYFYFNQDRGWTVISDSDIKVIFNESDGFLKLNQLRSNINPSEWLNSPYNNRFFNKFTLVTPDGNKYSFGGLNATEYSISYYHRNSSDLIATTWYLTKIESSEGRQVTLDYEPGDPICNLKYSPQKRILYNMACNPPQSDSRGYSALTGYLMFPVYLKSIQSSLKKIDFITIKNIHEAGPWENTLGWFSYNGNHINSFNGKGNSDRGDFTAFMKVNFTTEYDMQKSLRDKLIWRTLHAVSINMGSHSKTYYFEYGYNSRKTLACISERKGPYEEVTEKLDAGNGYMTIIVVPPKPETYKPKEFHFYYNKRRLPYHHLFAKDDSWGYFNGGEISFSAIPDFSIRSASLENTKAETLHTIKYPTDARTVFEYELHDYSKVVSESYNSLKSEFGTAGGLRVSAISTYTINDELAYKKRYYYTNQQYPLKNSNNSSGILRNPPVHKMIFYYDSKTNSWSDTGIKQAPQLEIYTHGGFVTHGTNNGSPHIGYSTVMEETIDKNNNPNGFIKYRFTNYDEDIWGQKHMDQPTLFSTARGDRYYNQFASKSMERGKLISEEYYDKNRILVKSVKHQYSASKDPQSSYFMTAHQEPIFFCNIPYNAALLSSLFRTYTYSYFQTKTIEEEYDGVNKVATEKRLTYTDNKLLKSEEVINSNGDVITNEYRYPQDILAGHSAIPANSALSAYKELADRNRLNIPVEMLKKTNGKVTESTINILGRIGNKVLPTSTYILETDRILSDYQPYHFKTSAAAHSIDTRCTLDATYQEYDKFDNPIIIKYRDSNHFYHWGEYGLWPSEEIRTDMTIEELISYSGSPNKEYFLQNPHGLGVKIIENYPQYSNRLSSKKNMYNILGQITSVDEVNNSPTYYEYDILGRLKRIGIFDKGRSKILKAFDYQYKD